MNNNKDAITGFWLLVAFVTGSIALGLLTSPGWGFAFFCVLTAVVC